MLVIRFFRVGKKNQPSFKIVVTDKTKPPRAGRFVEEVGFYNPLKKEKVLKPERIKYWMSVGAQPSATVHNLLISEKIVEGKKIAKNKKSKKETAAVPLAAEAKSAEGAKTEKKESSEDAAPTEKTEIKEELAPVTEEQKAE